MTLYRENNSNAVLAEQTRMLYSASTPSSIATIANGSILVIALWSAVEQSHLILWYCSLVIVTLGRLLLNRTYNNSSTHLENADTWSKRFILGTCLISCIWAASPLFLFPSDSFGHQVFLAFVLAGMCAGAVTTLSYLRITILTYLTLVLLPVAIQFIRVGSDLSLTMGIMTVFFYLITASSGIRIYKNTAENILIRFKSVENEKALRESETRYRSIVDSAPLGIIHYDQHETILSCNPAFSRLTNHNNTITGKRLNQVFSDPEAMRIMTSTRTGGENIYTGNIMLPGGTEPTPLRIHFRGIIGDNDELVGGVAIVEDRSNDTRIERLQNEFISTVSHELRTPLTAIKGALDLLSTDPVKQQPEMSNELLSNARRNSDRLLNLINDILDLDKIKQGKMQYNIQRTELMPLIEQAVATNVTYGKQHNVEFKILNHIDGIYVDIDTMRISQVLTNLLSNAAKFSSDNSSVEITVKDHSENNSVCIAVKDYGCGIPEEFHDRIFRKFSQYDGSDIRKVGGTGLGLNISKAIIEYHQGTISFESEANQGTTFYVNLPKAGSN